MGAISQIPEFYTRQFEASWRMLTQQKDSKLERLATVENVVGKEKRLAQIGSLAMQRVTSRAAETRHTDVPMAQRWLRQYPYDVATLEDEFDELFLGSMSSPRSALMQAHVSAYNRALDDVIIAALGGTAYTGEEGVTAVTLPSSQQVAVDYVKSGAPANSGLTLAKIIKAKSILGVNEVDDDEEFIWLYSQQQLDDLLNNVEQVSNADYTNVKALVEGKIDRFMGFTWKKTQRLPLNSGTDVRTNYAYAKSGIAVAPGPRGVHQDVLPTRNHALQTRSIAVIGATRTEEVKVVEVFCDQSP